MLTWYSYDPARVAGLLRNWVMAIMAVVDSRTHLVRKLRNSEGSKGTEKEGAAWNC